MKKYLYIVMFIALSVTSTIANAQSMTMSADKLATMQQVGSMTLDQQKSELARLKGQQPGQPKVDQAKAIADFMYGKVEQLAQKLFSSKAAEALAQIPVPASGSGYTKYMYSVAIPSQAIARTVEWRPISLNGEMVLVYDNIAFAMQKLIPIDDKNVPVWLPLAINRDLTVKSYEKDQRNSYQKQLQMTAQGNSPQGARSGGSDTWTDIAMLFQGIGLPALSMVLNRPTNGYYAPSSVGQTSQYYATSFVQGSNGRNAAQDVLDGYTYH